MKPNLNIISNNIDDYLINNEIIDSHHISISQKAIHLCTGLSSDIEKAKVLYEFVRDSIAHSFDTNTEKVTCTASDVLKYEHGICYAKTHLLAALLRAISIPSGFCYQKLIFDDMEYPYLVLHGLNAFYVRSLNKWIRVDARGNKPLVNAQFSINDEQLAFSVRQEMGEEDGLSIYANPFPAVIKALQSNQSCSELKINLPRG